MPDQVPVVPADGAVAAAVDPPVVAPPASADAAGDNNAQNAYDNVVPAPQNVNYGQVYNQVRATSANITVFYEKND